MGQSSTATFLEYAREARAEIDAALEEYSDFGEGCPRVLRDAVRHSLLSPGKRLRPLLVLMAAESCGCSRREAMPAAAAVEMVHTYSLIHDDLPAMDDDDIRRGRPTCHAVYGEAVAILAGDALLARAFEVLVDGSPSSAVAAGCCRELAQAAGASALVGGQVDDLTVDSGDGGAERLEAIHRRKTGAMFLVSLRLGGLVGRADDAQMGYLADYGRKLGLAFQIVDDLLDVQGDEAKLGKRTQKDANRGKLTFPGVLGVAESAHRAERLVEEACAAVAAMGSRARHLVALARYVVERKK